MAESIKYALPSQSGTDKENRIARVRKRYIRGILRPGGQRKEMIAKQVAMLQDRFFLKNVLNHHK